MVLPDLSVVVESRPVADIDVSWWRETAVLTIEGRRYRVYREGLMSGAFILESAGTVLARAEKASAFRRTLLIHYEGREYALGATSVFRRHLFCRTVPGKSRSLAPNSVFTRRGAVDLYPTSGRFQCACSIIWLTLILWMRDMA